MRIRLALFIPCILRVITAKRPLFAAVYTLKYWVFAEWLTPSA